MRRWFAASEETGRQWIEDVDAPLLKPGKQQQGDEQSVARMAHEVAVRYTLSPAWLVTASNRIGRELFAGLTSVVIPNELHMYDHPRRRDRTSIGFTEAAVVSVARLSSLDARSIFPIRCQC
ncbi:hypothetical protein C8035_v006094 [Colletotrichum spinosum]|uniref:Uncharacterized protein n=1 Tax=Colletotrichum spinosum TaxID=1347390 RepID=A0A4R8Q8Q7_9PEZI|nr:hypothetical protein C8035_v006094 [Colletotrichum spinosum]